MKSFNISEQEVYDYYLATWQKTFEDDYCYKWNDYCYECSGYGDDYGFDEKTGEWESKCKDCPLNSLNNEEDD